MAAIEFGKEDLEIAVIGRSQNIVYFNAHKQIYYRPRLIDGLIQSPLSKGGASTTAYAMA